MVDGSESSPKPVLSGVPQGTVLGPLLFLIYINDIGHSLSQGTKIRLFADDSLLYRVIKSKEDGLLLQKTLMPSRSGKLPGKWNSIPKNVNY